MFLISSSLLSLFWPCSQKNMKERERTKRKTCSVHVHMLVYWTHTRPHTNSLQSMCVCGSMCVFRWISPWSFYLDFLLPKTAAHFFLHMCFLPLRLGLQNINQTLTWALNELKTSSQIMRLSNRSWPICSLRLTPSWTDKSLSVFSHYTVHKLTVLAPEALTAKLPQAETRYLQSPSRVLIWDRDSQAPQESTQLWPQDPLRVQLPSPDVWTSLQFHHTHTCLLKS